MVLSFLTVSLLSIFVICDLLNILERAFSVMVLCVRVLHVPVVCDDGGCVGGDVGWLSPSWLRGTCGTSTLSIAAPFCLPVGGPWSRWTGEVAYGTVCWGPTQRR